MANTQTRQFCFRLREPNTGKKRRLEQTLDRFQSCVNRWIGVIDEFGEYPTRKNIHNQAYSTVREEYSGLHASTVQECMNRAISIMRNRPESLPDYSADSMSFKSEAVRYGEDNIGVPTIGINRTWLPLIVPEHFNDYRGLDKGQCQIRRRGSDWYAIIGVEYPTKDSYDSEGVLGVDLGIRNLAVASTAEGDINKFYTGKMLSGRENLESRRIELAKRKAGGNNVWRALKRLSGKEATTTQEVNHRVAKDIAKKAYERRYSIALEDLKGVREGENHKHMRKMLHRWAYQDFIHKITYKAEALGTSVHYVNPEGTSSTCSDCGRRKTNVEDEKVFKCRGCGKELDRDLNAARNIAARATVK